MTTPTISRGFELDLLTSCTDSDMRLPHGSERSTWFIRPNSHAVRVVAANLSGDLLYRVPNSLFPRCGKRVLNMLQIDTGI